MLLLLRLGLAGFGGLLVYASYEPLSWWCAGIVGITLCYFALVPWGRWPQRRWSTLTWRSGALIGFVHCLGCYLFLLPWVGEFVGNLPYLALAIVLALYGLATGAFGTLIARWRLGFMGFPFAYGAVEYARSSFPFGGFPWVRLAWGQIDGPFAALARWGGPALVTLAATMMGSALAVLVIRRLRVAGVGVIAVTIVAAALAGAQVGKQAGEVGTVTAAAVQGNVPRLGLDFNAQRRAVLNNHVRETETLQGRNLDLVIWPENASDVDPFSDLEAGAAITRVVSEINAPILVGTITEDDIGPRNTMQVFDPETGPGEYHYKKFLQPFGETMPLRSFFRLFSPLVDKAGDFQPGDGDGVVHMGTTAVGVATCYEVAFDPAYRDAVLAGAQLLTTPTNNATFGFTDMTYQQLAMSRMRAIELDRAVIVAATSGVSAMVHPDGSVSQSTNIFEAATLTEELALRDTITPAARYEQWIQWGIAVCGAVAIAAALYQTRTRSRGK